MSNIEEVELLNSSDSSETGGELDEFLKLLKNFEEGRIKRKTPSEIEGYGYQLYQTLESCDADTLFTKSELEAGATIQLPETYKVTKIQHALGTYMATVLDRAQTAWQFVLDDNCVPEKLQVGDELIAYVTQSDIDNAIAVYGCPTLVLPHKIYAKNCNVYYDN